MNGSGSDLFEIIYQHLLSGTMQDNEILSQDNKSPVREYIFNYIRL
jgi:hypothetical protein